MQRLLSTTDWDPEAVRDALFTYVQRHLGDPKGILAIDETGFLKREPPRPGSPANTPAPPAGWRTARSGCSSPTPHHSGARSKDRELYLPKAWTDDAERCQRAGIPEDRAMSTKPVLAAEMIERALDAGIEAEWATGDAVYGQHSGLCRRLEARGMHCRLGRVHEPARHHPGTRNAGC